ncbi:MAG: carboxy-S-adenosyl-L-methionine synthase CmoA [Pseudomonadota bacterium]
MARDEVYRGQPTEAGSFEFSEAVVKVFPDMIERSVPGYRLLLDHTPLLVRNAVQPNSRIYDLGCSIGAATLAARRAVPWDDVEIIAVDASPNMVERCRQCTQADNSRVPVKVVEADVTELVIESASVVLLYFTLQFIAQAKRNELIRTIQRGLKPGGVLILAEKLCFEPHQQQWLDQHHHDFKRSQGYSDLEIARKRQALEQVLVPETLDAHQSRLLEAGFSHVVPWFQSFNFAALTAIK